MSPSRWPARPHPDIAIWLDSDTPKTISELTCGSEGHKFCDCGCGKTIPALRADGKPRRFAFGHVSKLPAMRKALQREKVSDEGSRKRIRKLIPLRPCDNCGAEGSDRHHRDGNPQNNAIENITVLCRRCHMLIDGRIDALVAARRAVPLRTHCLRGHKYTEDNVIVDKRNGQRRCRICNREKFRQMRRRWRMARDAERVLSAELPTKDST